MSGDNHLGLPEEVFEIILQHLDLEDVLSCSLVCLGWRNAVNSDHIWGKLCKKNIPEERLKLQTERKRVGSSYEVFESDNLPRVCFLRTRYMDDVDLKRNWKNGCFKEDFVCDNDSFILSPLKRVETDNELLLVPKSLGSSSSPHTVFNIVDNPIMTDEKHPALKYHIPALFKLSYNILAIVQRTLLQVYVKDEDKNLKFKFFGLFDRNHSETIPDTQDLSNWYKQICYPCDTRVECDHNGKYFVGMYSRYNVDVLWYSPLYIWDLEFQTKVQEVAFPQQMPGERLLRASFFLRGNIILIILTYQSCTSIYSYDIIKSSYSKTVLQPEGCLSCLLFLGKVALMLNLTKQKLFLFDLRDGRMLDTLTNRYRKAQHNTVQAFGNLITYADHGFYGGSPAVNVYDTEKLCLVDKFQIDPKYGSVSKIHIVIDDLMIISTLSRQLLIRHMKTREILRTVECPNFFPPDPSCSKIVVLKPGPRNCKLVVRHFW